jgi:hypothetical protein
LTPEPAGIVIPLTYYTTSDADVSSEAGRSAVALPDFLIAGVPKAGTTALYAALARHPELFFPRVKEPKFFLTDGRPPRSGGPGDAQTYQQHVWRQAEYEALFDPAPPYARKGEATPFYLYETSSHERIRRVVPDVRIVIVLRDPVDRAYSNWSHLWAAGLEAERDFVTACGLEGARREAGWAHFWHYVGQGRYGEQLSALYEHFPREQVLLLRYRDLRDEPYPTLDRVCAFLGVQTGLLDRLPAQNVSPYVADNYVNDVLRAMLRTGGRFGQHFPVPLRKVARGPLLTVLQRHKGARPKASPEQRDAVLPYFVDDIRLLERITGEYFGDWLTVGDVPALAG